MIRINSKQTDSIKIRNTRYSLTNLIESIVSTFEAQMKTQRQGKRRVNNFCDVKTSVESQGIKQGIRTKLGIFNTNVKSMLLYGSKTWIETSTSMKPVQVFVRKCLRKILKKRWPNTINNVDLQKISKHHPVEVSIRTHRLYGDGIWHALREANINITKQVLKCNTQGQRKQEGNEYLNM